MCSLAIGREAMPTDPRQLTFDAWYWPAEFSEVGGAMNGKVYAGSAPESAPGPPVSGTCPGRLNDRIDAAVSGRFDNDSTLVAEEVLSYGLTSGETVSVHIHWQATRN